jgi:predicted enzyme related to lactoylglutathione lyase
MPAPIVHIEFPSVDFARTAAFYGQLFGWQTQQNATATYMKFDGDSGPSGGWVRADMAQSAGPIPYLPVDDLTKMLDKVERAGGRVMVRSMTFAGGGEVALVADPDGNVIGLWMRKREGGKPVPPKATEKAAAPKVAEKATTDKASSPKTTTPTTPAKPAKPAAKVANATRKPAKPAKR